MGCLILVGLYPIAPAFAAPVVSPSFSETEPSTPDSTLLLDPAAVLQTEVNGKAYVLYDTQSGEFLIGKNPDAHLAPASITKVMTVLLALENLDLTDTITIRKEMFSTIPNDYVRLGLYEGEEITVEQALYATLLISANDAATALALTMADSVEAFADMMNDRAKELGCTGTHFTNPYGYADPENITTAHDMALILAAALEHETYTDISTTRQYLMAQTNMYGTRGFTNNNRFICTEQYQYEPYVGGKTGFTNLSGHTIAAGARQGDRTLVGVILGSTTSETRYANLIDMFDYGFQTFSTTSVDAADFEQVKQQAVLDLEARIRQEDLNLIVKETRLTLQPYVTALKTRDTKGYTSIIGSSEARPQAGLSSQTLLYPLLREYADGTTTQVGTLEISLVEPPPTVAVGTQPAEPGDPGEDPLPLIVRIGIVVLAVILILGIALAIMIRYEINRRKRRYRRSSVRRPL